MSRRIESRSTISYKILKLSGSLSTDSIYLTSLRHIGHLTLKLWCNIVRHSVQKVCPQWIKIRGIFSPTLNLSPQK